MPARLMSDEGVHEIQLNGKQLVFMFMAVTVVAVVIFLCGVMVGRGVRAPRVAEQADATLESPLDPTAAIQAPAPSASDSSGTGAPVSAEEKLTYPDRLSTTPPPPETLKEPTRTDVKPAAAVKERTARGVPGPQPPRSLRRVSPLPVGMSCRWLL